MSILSAAWWGNASVAVIGGLIVVAAVVFGWRDLRRFRLRRVTAIAGVCFAESIRRRVLWVIPLAIVGVVAVTQLTRPYDVQNAVRETTKYSVFASGLIVVIAAVILSCTNLPKEIDSRVIFTIVTKPTTRFEIVLGKVCGFAAITFLILLIMGLFAALYSSSRAWSLERSIKTALESGDLDSGERARLAGYRDAGLLDTKSVQLPEDLQVYTKAPSPDGTRWFGIGETVFCTVPFAPSEEEKDAFNQACSNGAQPFLIATLKVVTRPFVSKEETDALMSGDNPLEEGAGLGPFLSNAPLPRLRMSAFSQSTAQPLAVDALGGRRFEATRDRNAKPGGDRVFPVALGQSFADLLDVSRFNVELAGITPTLFYGAGQTPLELVAMKDGQVTARIPSSTTVSIDSLAQGHDRIQLVAAPGPHIASHVGPSGMQLAGNSPDEGGGNLAVFAFRNVGNIEAINGMVDFQLEVVIDRIGDLDSDRFKSSTMVVQVVNRKNPAATSAPINVELDVARKIDIPVPHAAVEGGDFDVTLAGMTPRQFLGIKPLETGESSVVLVRSHDSFVLNLIKSLTVLWLLSILVIAISVFCSTFLSWPIAVVLTMFLLLGRWGVDQLGDSLSAGATRSWVGDLFGTRDASKNSAVVNSMEALTGLLRNMAPVLPDVTRFPVLEDLDRGITMPGARLGRAVLELLLYGLPVLFLTYIIFRNKEVAP